MPKDMDQQERKTFLFYINHILTLSKMSLCVFVCVYKPQPLPS